MKQPSENGYFIRPEYQANLQYQCNLEEQIASLQYQRNLEERIASLQQQLHQQSHNSYSSQSHNSTYINIDEPISTRNSTSTSFPQRNSTSTSFPQHNSTSTRNSTSTSFSQHNSFPKKSTPAQPKLMTELIADYKKTDKYKRENPDLPDKINSFQNPFFMNTSMAHVGLY